MKWGNKHNPKPQTTKTNCYIHFWTERKEAAEKINKSSTSSQTTPPPHAYPHPRVERRK